MSVIKTGTTSTTGYIVESDTNGNLVIQTGSTPTTALTLNSNQTATFAQSVNIPNTFGFKNRIINGGMVIDQRNAGASVTVTGGSAYYSCDRWQQWMSQNSKYSIQRSTTAPVGFINSLLATSLSAYSVVAADSFALNQNIEGLNIADLAWGTANAATVTLSFWVRSSLTGTFGGAISNSAVNRSYPFTYTISAANTFEYKTITIAGDTSGTWLTDNGIGIRLWFSIGAGSTYLGTAGAWAGADYRGATGQTSVVGTNGATFYITGVQLERGSTATSFDFRPYGTELMLCQRYFETYAMHNTSLIGTSTSSAAGTVVLQWTVSKRAAPTLTLPAAGQSSGTITFLTSGGSYPLVTGTHAAETITVNKATITGSSYSGLTSNGPSIFYSTSTSTIQISAEL